MAQASTDIPPISSSTTGAFLSLLQYPSVSREEWTIYIQGCVHVCINYRSAQSFIQVILDLPLRYIGAYTYLSMRTQISSSVLKQKSEHPRVCTKIFLSNTSYSTKWKFCLADNPARYYRTYFFAGQ